MNQVLSRVDDVSWNPNKDRLSERDFLRIADLIGGQVGIKLPIAKRLMVEARLRRRVKAVGLRSIDEYCRFVFDRNGILTEQIHLINAVTTNKTDFFREVEHFHFLEGHIIPALLKHRSRVGNRPIKLWSAASSNGAEAYTIAIVMSEIAARIGDIPFAILGTDISTEMLENANRAVYPESTVEPVPAKLRQRYFLRGTGPTHLGKMRIAPELRRLVQFQRMNLADNRYPVDRDVDVIFLRNVLIYFEKEMQEAVIGRLMDHLQPGGFLVLGHSESMIGSNMGLRQWAPGVFGKAGR